MTNMDLEFVNLLTRLQFVILFIIPHFLPPSAFPLLLLP